MGLEAVSYINDLVTTNPAAGDVRSEGDDHLRNLKVAVKACFPGLAGQAWRSQTKSAGYTGAATDNLTLLNCTAGLTLALTAAATLGNGWMCIVFANGGAVVIDPNGAETVNGAATMTLTDGSAGLLLCNGTSFVLLALIKAVSGGVNIPGTFAVTGTITPSQTNGIVGTTTNNSANALSVGEYVSGTLAVGSATSLTTATAKTIISISLTAGDWDVAATGYILPAAGTQVASVASSISQTNNTLDTANGSIVSNALGNMVVATFSTEHGVPVAPVRISLSGTTTIYLVMTATFSVSTMTAYGNIRARRVR